MKEAVACLRVKCHAFQYGKATCNAKTAPFPGAVCIHNGYSAFRRTLTAYREDLPARSAQAAGTLAVLKE